MALEMWRAAPDRVTRLALLDTGADPPAPDEPAKRQAMLAISAGRGDRCAGGVARARLIRP